MATFNDMARRVYNHTWKLDPIVRSLLDTDFYKLLMLQMIWGLYPKVDATFSLINRTRSVRLADEIDIDELRAQLDHVRELRFTKKEMIWLAGNSFYGSKQIFEPGFLKWLETFALPKVCVLVFGQESVGVSDAVREVAQATLAIAQYGSTRSINAGAAAAIAMHTWVRQHGDVEAGHGG